MKAPTRCRYCDQPIRRNRSSSTGWVHADSRQKLCARQAHQLVPDTRAEPLEGR